MIIVDTNVVSEAAKSVPYPTVMSWSKTHAVDLRITSVTVGELLTGVVCMPDGKRRQSLAEAVEMVLLRLAAPLPFDERAARVYAEMRGIARRVGRGLSTEDGMIAAICVVHGATLATRNTRDFEFLPLPLVNPWDAGQ